MEQGRPGPVLETWALDGGHVLGVWGFHGERKGEKESGGVGSELLDIRLCASAGKGIRELYKLD